MIETTLWGRPPGSLRCIGCAFTTASFAALFAHCAETGHGQLPGQPGQPDGTRPAPVPSAPSDQDPGQQG